MKRIAVAILALACLLTLAACRSRSKLVDEKVIRNDIMCQDDVIYSSEMSMKSFQISKRQTNEDDKVDFVWVDFTAENEDCRYVVSCKLTYGLYNDGWLLDNYEVLDQSMEYLNSPDPEKILARANELMDQYYAHFGSRNKGEITLVDMGIQGDRCSCLLNHAEVMGETDILTIHWRFRLECRLDEDGWSSGAWNGTMNTYLYEWNLVGQWEGSNEGEDFSMTVHSYDPKEMTVDVEYVFGDRRSNGIETMYIVNQDFWDQEQKAWSLSDDELGHSGFVDLYPFGASYVDAGEGVGVLASSSEVNCWLHRVK